jgi:hypothetical protein
VLIVVVVVLGVAVERVGPVVGRIRQQVARQERLGVFEVPQYLRTIRSDE